MAARFHWSVYWGAVVVAGLLLVVAGVVGGRMTAPTPEPRVETITHEIPPACLEIEAALQAERARLAKLEDIAANADALSAGLPAVVLTNDSEQIVEHAKAVDDANRAEQAARLQLADEMTALDAVVRKCAPERDR